MSTSAVISAALGLLASAGVAAAQSFTLLGPGSIARAVSSDGGSVAGSSGSIPNPGFVWTAATGRIDFGLEAGLPPITPARGVSLSGSTVVGSAGSNGDNQRAYRWRGPGTFESLGVQAPYTRSYANDANEDGSVVVGLSAAGGSAGQAFRWTSTTGLVGLGFTTTGQSKSEATCVDSTGNIVAGYSGGTVGFDAFVWTPAVGMQVLPQLPGTSGRNSYVYGMNASGSILVGYSGSPLTATMWQNGQAIGLGHAPGFARSTARGVNDAGTLVVGWVENNFGDRTPSVWTPERGMETFQGFLIASGLNLPEGTFGSEIQVSNDGRTFVGSFLSPIGDPEAFVVVIPAPATLLLLPGMFIVRRRIRSAMAS